MTELLTAAQMRAVEQAAIGSGAVTGLELMERAGAGVVEAVFKEWPDLSDGTHRAVVLCGPGNNGGDGFVVARLLAECGWSVEVFLFGDADNLPPDAKTNHDRWRRLGDVASLTVNALEASQAVLDPGPKRDGVIIDAVFGTGLARPVEGDLARCLGFARSAVPLCFLRYVAVDVQSGVCADSGKLLMSENGQCPHDFAADLVVSFHRAKVGHYLGSSPRQSATLSVVDIGLDPVQQTYVAHDLGTLLSQGADGLRASLAREAGIISTRGAHLQAVTLVDGYDALLNKAEVGGTQKFDHGHALVLSGGPGRTGAARLAARGALRIGAGLVTVGVPPAAQMEVASHITALMLARVADGEGLAMVLADDRINALCLGPGLGLGDHAADLIDTVLGGGHLRPTRHVVFDADALTLIAQDSDRMKALNAYAVLTPHGGEFARLFPDISDRLADMPKQGPAYSKVDATRDAAARCGAIVLLKGPDTVIAHPDGRASVHAAVHDRAAPWLATAGAGDVLAGFITGLLARGFDPMAACETAAWLHVECARAFGPGLIAEDLPETLPQVLRALIA